MHSLFNQCFAESFPPVTIPDTQAILLSSIINQTNYELQIALPSQYKTSDKRYPVLYLLDANNDFPLVTSISRRLYQEDDLQPIIIVGMSYVKDAYIHRFADYTPTVIASERITGKANDFLHIIEKEIIPLIDSKFRTKKNDRTLAGHSLGGLLGAYQVISNKGLFNQYIISSASLWWDEFKTLSFAQKHDKKPNKVFISVGDLEGDHMKESADRLIRFIQTNQPKTMLEHKILDGETHGSAKFRAYADGIKWLFKEK